MSPLAHPPLTCRLRAELYTQLAQMEIAGLPFDRAFALLDIAAPAKLRVEAMKKLTSRGLAPAEAGKKSGLFNRLDARLIHAAFTAGSPGGMYRRLADLYTQRAMHIATLKSRLLMPAFVLLAALFIDPLPALIGGSIGMGGFMLQVLRPLIVLVAMFYAGRWLWTQLLEASLAASRETLLFRIPWIGRMIVRRNVRDFVESLALMLEAGISMLDALPTALDTLEIGAIRREFAKIMPRIEKGATLAGAMAGLRYLDSDTNGNRLIEFVKTAEASGTLPEMLMRHTAMETESINDDFQQIAEWVPRAIYGLVMLWIAYGVLASGVLVSTVPKNL